MKKIGYELWFQTQPKRCLYLIVAHGKKRLRLRTNWKIVHTVNRPKSKKAKTLVPWMLNKHQIKPQLAQS